MSIHATFMNRACVKRGTMAALLATTGLALCAPVLAQTADQDDGVEEIVIQSFRATIQNSIETKRESLEIVDALSADDIGDLPALSIGEALETITGAASHREQGGATEIAIRGLGPFLSSTTINGRVAANGSGDRSVNFSQFPSELFNKLAIYKTQAASRIEGGVAGQIALESVKPLDVGRRSIQGELKLNYNPDNNDIASDQRARDLGYRGTFSYVDQYDVGDGKIGIALGYQRNVTTNPEQEARSSTEYRDCRYDPTNTSGGVFDDGNCDSGSGDLRLEVDPETGVAPDADTDFVLAPSSRSYRQNITDDNRDAFFGAVQWQPSNRVDISADFQFSDRKFSEIRNGLNLAENRRIDGEGDINRLPYDLIRGDNGEVLQFTSEQRVETFSEFQVRDETYYGGGLAVEYEASDRLTVSFDASYSETQRTEVGLETRLQSDGDDIFGDDVTFTPGFESDGTRRTDRPETATQIGQNGSQIYNFILQEFDPNDHNLFSDSARTRYDLEQDRFNSIFALRGDANYQIDMGMINSFDVGLRYQKLKFRDVPGASNGSSRFEVTYDDREAVAIASQACRTAFPESGFLESVSGGNPLFTIVDPDNNVISTSNTYATFDPFCLAQNLEANDSDGGTIEFDEDGLPIFPTGDFASSQNSDVRETSWAGYIQSNFEGELGSFPVRGNFGLRVVHTDVESIGLRGVFTSNVETDEDGNQTLTVTEDQSSLVAVSGGGSYTKFLPSLNLVADVAPDMQARFAVFRAMSRPDPSTLGFGRSFNGLTDDTEDAIDLANAVGSATAAGNPLTNPLMSWNFDAALEWYPNADTILAGGVYYKSFNGGFVNTAVTEEFTVDGQPFETIVSTTDTTGENSEIFGFELTAAHSFNYLPGALSGLGFKLSYNYASSNFEFEDGNLGAGSVVDSNGNSVQRVGIVPPAEIFGLSKHVLAAQAYYSISKFDFQLVYKYRSQYFQQFINTPDRIRYVGNTGVYEARIAYKITDNIRATLEGINLFNEPRRQFVGTENNIAEVNAYGARFFAGIRAKF